MSASAAEFDLRPSARRDKHALAVDNTHWGYSIRDAATKSVTGMLVASSGRFIGAILLMAAAGLWIMPDALLTPEVLGMKLGAMVMFTILGGYIFWVGRTCTPGEFQFDTTRNEVRIGTRAVNGAFREKGVLNFGDISSVFLLRSKEQRNATRLFLRVGTGNDALEIATGKQDELERLRDRITRDLQRAAEPPAPAQPVHRQAEKVVPRRVA
ncbi:hypothetical protein [Maritimibacter fusiformis]|uniref:Uncharacterized protein n=1 Tax=Maritimibacter fusiformis TaxID=2603819 RepID=A0A5D0RKX1_9RHOB|nr:hypothetical protein [Maritimibacter fusiformis]TYB81288.1 hypothetical protein FVF75_09175 [Maritimibacter fusiformis]